MPAFGNPTRPTSATVRSSTRRRFSSPSSPGSDVRGTRLRALASAALPRPPRPPCATTAREPSPTRSAIKPSSSETTVPSGTGTIRSLPVAPSRFALRPATPAGARWCGWSAIHDRSWTPRETSNTTEPPAPPFPPSGPPWGLYGSLCIDAEPFPPRPAFAYTSASSTNVTRVQLRWSLVGRRAKMCGCRRARPSGWSAWTGVRWRTTSEARSRSSRMPSFSPRRRRGSSTASRSPRCSDPSA